MPNKQENCKQLIKQLIHRCEPPELALQNYSRQTYEKAKNELLLNPNECLT